MTQSGWYPDPSGTPARYRYWDGTQWSAVTTSDPSSPPPGDTPPPPPPAPGGHGDVQPTGSHGGFTGAMRPMPPTDSGPSGGGHGKVVLVAIAAVLALLLLGVATFFGVRALTDAEAKRSDDVPAASPTDEGGDELVPPSDDTDESPGGTPPAAGECLRGAPTILDDQSGSDRISGPGISMPRVEGYQVDPFQSFAFTWAFDFTPQVQTVEEGWASLYGVGGVETAFGSPDAAADAVLQCMATSPNLYSGFESRTDLASERIDVPGAETAWSLTAEVRVANPAVEVAGDVVQVIVVDTGDDEMYGLYISVVPIGDKDRIAQQKQVADAVRAE